MTTLPSIRPQLSCDELQQVRWLLGGVLSLLAITTVAYLNVEGWWLMVLTGGTVFATTLWPTLPARVPRLAHTLAFPVIATFFALDLWLRAELLPAMVRLDLLLLLYRALVYRQRRDDLQIIVLGLFLIIVAGVLTVSLVFAVQLLVYTACALVFLLTLTLLDTARRVLPPAEPEIGAPAWAAHANWKRLARRVSALIDWRILLLASGLFVGVIGASALLFLIIPRFQLDNGMFLERFISRKARTGFSDAISFGDVTQIQQDTSIALHVDVSDPGDIPLAPYWRMLVLDDYQGGMMRMSPALRAQRFSATRTRSVVFGVGRARRQPVRWKIYLEPGVSRYLPLLGQFQLLKFAEPQTYRNAPELALLALAKDPVTMTAYQVDAFDVSSRLRDLPGDRYGEASTGGLNEEERATLRRLATEATGGEHLATGEFSGRLCSWLRQRHPYSLAPRIPTGAGDPLVRWADSTAEGHCELFAGSFVLLARAAGYRARVVTGFRGGTWNAFSSSFTVRNSDAHAWAEIFDRQTGSWLRADPLELPAPEQASGSNADALLARRTDRSWAARVDSLRVFWYRRVVNFDEQSQVHTLKVAKELVQAGIESLRQRTARGTAALRAWWAAPLDWRRAGGLVGGAILVVVLVFGARRVRVQLLRWSFWRTAAHRDDPIRREAGRWLRRIRERHGECADARTTEALRRLRYGPRHSWPDPVKVFAAARRELRAARRERRVDVSVG